LEFVKLASFARKRWTWEINALPGGAIASLWVRRKHPAPIDNHRFGLIMRVMKRLDITGK
jgi:hypothetical protein